MDPLTRPHTINRRGEIIPEKSYQRLDFRKQGKPNVSYVYPHGFPQAGEWTWESGEVIEDGRPDWIDFDPDKMQATENRRRLEDRLTTTEGLYLVEQYARKMQQTDPAFTKARAAAELFDSDETLAQEILNSSASKGVRRPGRPKKASSRGKSQNENRS